MQLAISEPESPPLNCGLEDRKMEGGRKSISGKRNKDREAETAQVGSSKGHWSGTFMLGEAGDGRTDKVTMGGHPGQDPGLNYKWGLHPDGE